ncbi:MAG: DUF434 domain-containing protein, partial [Bacteroidota bacterium]
MPNKQKNRGMHPDDLKLFSADHVPALQSAVADLSWLLERGYAINAALKLVGDRFRLTARQRLPVSRSACSDTALARRQSKVLVAADLQGRNVAIDGFNLLISLECALSDAFLFRGRDGCLRDIASIHGSYRKVQQTLRAIEMVGTALATLAPAKVHWFL